MKTLVLVLFGAVLGMTASFVAVREAPRGVEKTTARAAAATVSTTVAARSTPKPAAPAIPRCSAIDVPVQPSKRIACRTAQALLQITGQARPLVVGGTNVRVLNAFLSGSDVVTRLRVRNETKTEQGVQAGGQELYLNLGGKRIDSFVLSSQRVAPATGKTVKLRYRLTMGELAQLEGAGFKAELGVRPWEGSTVPGRVVGVIRLRVRTPAT